MDENLLLLRIRFEFLSAIVYLISIMLDKSDWIHCFTWSYFCDS